MNQSIDGAFINRMTRPKRIIMIEIDNTLADTQRAFTEYLESISQNSIDPESLGTELRGDGLEWNNPYVREFIESKDHRDTVLAIRPYVSSMRALKKLTELGEVHVVSSRIENWHEPTQLWLASHGFMELVSSVHLRGVGEKTVDFKRRLAKELKVNYVFDDSVEVALGLKGMVEGVYLISQPWNRNFIPSSVGVISQHRSLLEAANELEFQLARK